MRSGALAVCLAAGSAFAWGPVAEGGAMVAGIPLVAKQRVFGGTTASLGVEFGDRFNHELAVEWVRLTGLSAQPAAAHALAARYTFSVDFFGKQGFSPTVGLGLSAGRFVAESPGDQVRGLFLGVRALAGVRYTFDVGLSLKALLAVNFYGQHLTVAPTMGVAWRF